MCPKIDYTTDFGTFVLLPPFLKTYLGRKKLTLGTFFQTSRTHIAVLLDAALLLGHDGDVRDGRPTHPLHDGSHFVFDGRRYVAKWHHSLRIHTLLRVGTGLASSITLGRVTQPTVIVVSNLPLLHGLFLFTFAIRSMGE